MGIPRPIYDKICIKCKKITKGYSKKCHSCSFKDNKKMEGKNNPQWKGNEVGYKALHAYIKRYKKRINICEHCKKNPSMDLANVSKKYKRKMEDWVWLCRRCHMIFDNQLSRLAKQASKAGNIRIKKGVVRNKKGLFI